MGKIGNLMKLNVVTKSIFVFLAFFISLVVVEILQRVFLSEPENLVKLKSSSSFLYENKPKAVFPYGVSDGDETEIVINSDGFRDDEFLKHKPEDVFRIAVLGDSQEEALQVPLSDTWQKVMSRKLYEEMGRRPEGAVRRVETYNFGVSGYGTDQQWLTLSKKVWQFVPDMVILAFSPNDVGDVYKNRLVRLVDSGIEVIGPDERAGGNFLGKLLRETYTYHLVIKAASGNEAAKRVVDRIRVKALGFPEEERFFMSDAQLVQGPFEVFASQKHPPSEVLEGWKMIKALVNDMKKQADDNKVQFLITINIPKAQVFDRDWEYISSLYKLGPGFLSYEINEVVGGIARELAISFYDPRLDAIEWRKKTGDLHYEYDAHFNVNGNLFMGTKMAEFIVKEGLIE